MKIDPIIRNPPIDIPWFERKPTLPAPTRVFRQLIFDRSRIRENSEGAPDSHEFGYLLFDYCCGCNGCNDGSAEPFCTPPREPGVAASQFGFMFIGAGFIFTGAGFKFIGGGCCDGVRKFNVPSPA